MGISMHLPECNMQTSSVIDMCEIHINHLNEVKKSIEIFISEEKLKGKAYESAKQYLSSAYIPLINGIILLAEAIKKAHSQFPKAYVAQVDSNSLDSQELEAQINKFNNLIHDMENIQKFLTLIPPAKNAAGEIASNYLHNQSKIKEKLEKLKVFDKTSRTIFSSIDNLLVDVQTGLSVISSDKSWNSTTGVYDLSNFNMNWTTFINESWTEYEEESKKREEEINKENKFKALKEIANVDEDGNITGIKYLELGNLLAKDPDDLSKDEREALIKAMEFVDSNGDGSAQSIQLLKLKALLLKSPGELLDNEKKTLSQMADYYLGKLKNKINGVEADIESSGNGLLNAAERKGFGLISPVVSPLLGFEYNEEGDYYYTNKHSFQSHAGYADVYEKGGPPLGMDLDTNIIYFNSRGKEYRLQLWKGSYGYGNAYGSEIGLYYKKDDSSNLETSLESKVPGLYPCVEEEDQIHMRSYLYDKNNLNKYLIKNDTARYTEDGKHFWDLAIKTDSGYTKDDLLMIGELEIEDDNMRNSVVEAMKENGSIEKVETNGKWVKFKWAE